MSVRVKKSFYRDISQPFGGITKKNFRINLNIKFQLISFFRKFVSESLNAMYLSYLNALGKKRTSHLVDH